MPTLNRHDFVVRALNYYSSAGFKGYICIGDSSGPVAAARTQKAIESFQDRLNIIYHACPSPPPSQGRDPLATPGEGICIKQLIDLVPTEYAALAPDDDFQIPNGMARCVEFLESHDGYSAAHGARIGFQLPTAGACGSMSSASVVRQPALAGPTAAERWSAYMRHPISPAYSVMRTRTMKRIFDDFAVCMMRYVGSELIPSGLIPVLGKVKELDCLSTVNHDHPERIWSSDSHSMYTMIMHPAWTRSADGLRKSITAALAEADRIDRLTAETIFDREFWNHITTVLRWQLRDTYSPSPRRAQSKLKRIHMAVTSMLARTVNLNNLLRPDSPFHTDFMPVYHATELGRKV